MSSNSFLIVGCGAVGILYTYALSRQVPESNIYAVCRSNRDVATQKGFKIDSEAFGRNLTVRPRVVGSIQEAVERHGDTFDYIIISTKSLPPFSQIPKAIAPAVRPGVTAIALFQNGIGIEDVFLNAYPTNPIISAVVYVKATEIEPAVVQHSLHQNLHVGTYPSSAPEAHKAAVTRLAQIFTEGGANVKVHEDIQVERWEKALVNAVWNPLCALTRLTDGAFLACDENVEDMARTLMRETASVARACGIVGIDDEIVERQLARNIARKPIGQRMSMFYDADAGRAMEVDAIIGNVIALGRKHQVAMPSLNMLHLLIKGLDTSFRSPR